MKKINVLIAIVIIGILSWSQVGASEIIEDKGTIEYMNSLQVDIDSNEEINLVFIASSMDESDITIHNYGFDYELNVTHLLFTSKHIDAEYWMEAGAVPYIYQEDITKQLYCIYVNYSSLEIPDDPWKTKYLNVSSEHNRTCQELNVTIYNLTITKEELDELIIMFTDTSQELNITLAQKENLTNLLKTKSSELKSEKREHNETKIIRDNALTNATIFKRFYKEMTSYTEGFNFKLAGRTEEFTTIYKYETDINKLEKQVAGYPIMIFFFVIITMVICFMIGYWKWSRKRTSPEEVEILRGIDPTTTLVNRFKSRLKMIPNSLKIKKEFKEIPTDEIFKAPEVKEQVREPEVKEEKHDDIRKYIDEQLKAIETTVGSNHTAIMQRLDEMTKTKA